MAESVVIPGRFPSTKSGPPGFVCSDLRGTTQPGHYFGCCERKFLFMVRGNCGCSPRAVFSLPVARISERGRLEPSSSLRGALGVCSALPAWSFVVPLFIAERNEYWDNKTFPSADFIFCCVASFLCPSCKSVPMSSCNDHFAQPTSQGATFLFQILWEEFNTMFLHLRAESAARSLAASTGVSAIQHLAPLSQAQNSIARMGAP